MITPRLSCSSARILLATVVVAVALLVFDLSMPVYAQNTASGAQPGGVASAPQVRVSRKDMAIDETVSLEIEIKRGGAPKIDTRTLEEDFEIIGRSSSTRTEIVNNRAAIQTTLSYILRPRREGRLTIPPFDIDNVTTSPVLINVKGAPQSVSEGAKLVAEIEPSAESAYINEQLILTLRITFSPEVGRLNGEPLTIDGAEVTEAIAERRFQRGAGDDTRNVYEIDYAVFPREVGEIVIAPRNYSGVVSVTPSAENNFQRGQRILSRTSRVRIAVLDPATDAVTSQHSPWLPASGVTTSTEWSSDPEQLTVGEPVTRTVTIQARGQRAAAIPPLEPIESADIKQYSEQPTLTDNQTETGVVGTRVQTSALVPVKAGNVTLPEQSFRWFDTASRTWRDAIVPAVTLAIAPGSGSETTAGPLTSAVGNPVSGTSLAATGSTAASITSHSWLTAILGGTTLLFALSSLMLWQRLGRLEAGYDVVHPQNINESPDADAAWRDVQIALRAERPRDLRHNLLQWARAVNPSSRSQSLDSLADRLDDRAAADALRAVDMSLYTATAHAIDYTALGVGLNALRNAAGNTVRTNHKSGSTRQAAALPDLYRP